MKIRLLAFLVLLVLGLAAAPAEFHRATRLGNPATRFAPPLQTPDDLRARFRDEKLQPDFAEVLRQWGWEGKLEDLFAAAATAEISEAPIAVGETLPFMSTRRDGKPVCLRNVLWAGKEPAPAYAFDFTSNGRRYRCLTPKACSNFLVIDLGPEFKPALTLSCSAPAEVLAGRTASVCLTVINTGSRPESAVTVTLPLPSGLGVVSLSDHGTTINGAATWELTSLGPLKGKELCATLAAGEPGTFPLRPVAQGATAKAASDCETKVIGIPAILLEVIDLDDPVQVGGKVTYEIKVTNQGSAPGTNIRVTCTLPASQSFISGEGATAVAAEEGTLTFAPLASLAPKASASWQVVVKASQAADARFKTQLTSDQFVQPITESESTEQY